MFVENPYTNTLFIDYFLCFFGVVRTITKCVYIVEKDDCVHISAQLIRLKKRKKKTLVSRNVGVEKNLQLGGCNFF